jgi:hypothetical protein
MGAFSASVKKRKFYQANNQEEKINFRVIAMSLIFHNSLKDLLQVSNLGERSLWSDNKQ